jgi:hypothetical protein
MICQEAGMFMKFDKQTGEHKANRNSALRTLSRPSESEDEGVSEADRDARLA